MIGVSQFSGRKNDARNRSTSTRRRADHEARPLNATRIEWQQWKIESNIYLYLLMNGTYNFGHHSILDRAIKQEHHGVVVVE